MYFDIFDFDPNKLQFSEKVNEFKEDGFIYGNSFSDEYVPYKNYNVYDIKPNSDESKLKVKIMEQSFIVNDLNLYLDVNPNDPKIYELFKKHLNLLETYVNDYERKYGSICFNSYDEKYNWLTSPWPWEDKYV